MIKTINNSFASGTIVAPPSKSQTIRAIAAASLCEGETIIKHYSQSDDAAAAIKIVQDLGSKVIVEKDLLKIAGGRLQSGTILNCGESALCLRLFSVIASLYEFEFELIAEKTLSARRTENIEQIMSALGVQCETDNGFPPITIMGPISGGHIKIDCSKSSQFLSGLLFALPLAKIDSSIEAINLKSRPYIEMTLELLSTFGIEIEHDDFKVFKIKANQKYRNNILEIKGDWSAAANFMVAAAINGDFNIKCLDINSKQGDKIILKLLKNIGAEVIVKENLFNIRHLNLQPFEFDSSDYPDLVPVLAVLGCYCSGTSIIKDIERLSGKETSRAEIIMRELNSIGGNLSVENNKLIVRNCLISGGNVNSHNDHRIAMALAIAGLNSKMPVTINNTDCVSKSYPDFWNDLEIITQSKDKL